MTAISLIDTTLRDGNPSNWEATGLDTGMMGQLAPVMNRVGFEAIDFTASTHMAVAVRFSKQNPWERLMASGKFERLYRKDPGGLVTPERARTLIPAIKAAIRVPLEVHSHCTIGLAALSYLEAAERGKTVCTPHPRLSPTAPANRRWMVI